MIAVIKSKMEERHTVGQHTRAPKQPPHPVYTHARTRNMSPHRLLNIIGPYREEEEGEALFAVVVVVR